MVRHGHYASAMWDPLDEIGKNQIRRLCLNLFDVLENARILVLSSGVNRAVQSAEIIRLCYSAPMEVHDCFFEWYSTPGASYLIRKKSDAFDAILIVGHKEFLTAFLAEHFKDKNLREMEFPMGAACVIDTENKSFFMIT